MHPTTYIEVHLQTPNLTSGRDSGRHTDHSYGVRLACDRRRQDGQLETVMFSYQFPRIDVQVAA
jgi:hypothetical protein